MITLWSQRNSQKSNRKSPLIHLVPLERLRAGSMKAYCGYDCTGRKMKDPGSEDCVVCIEMCERS